MVWDLGTRSGTFINGARVSQSASLQSGDELAFGKVQFLVRYGDGAAKPSRHAEQAHPRREPAMPV